MATATATATRNKNVEPDTLGRHCVYFGTIAISAGPDTYATNGLALSLALPGIPHTEPPVEVRVWTESPADGYEFMYVSGADNTAGKLVILAAVTVVNGTGPCVVEMTNATAIPAAISGDTKIKFSARYIHGK